ncbi:unnamed protein product, partial [Didymodactylos carnosus]
STEKSSIMVYIMPSEYESSSSYSDIKKIQFGILSPDEIKRMSVTTPEAIKYPQLMDDEDREKPKKGGLMDPRQGPSDRHSKCHTCGGTFVDCPGHFGHIELTKPVFHVGYLKKTVKILRCICFYCSKLRRNLQHAKIQKILQITKNQPRKRLELIYNACKNYRCCNIEARESIEGQEINGCGREQPKIQHSGLTLTIEWKNNKPEEFNSFSQTKIPLSAERVWHIFKNITEETCLILGMNPKQSRPEHMILTVLPVPPLCVRPSVLSDGTARAQDDLTYILANILKVNNQLKNDASNGASSIIIDDNIKILQFHCATLFDNNMAGMPQSCHNSGRPLKSIKTRLTGKEGRVRGNLMGKRVDFCGRSVITPDPNLLIDQLGVPRTIAQNLTYPEIVTPMNQEYLYELIRRNCVKYIIRTNGDRIDLKIHPKPSDLHLQNGYIVERQMIDNDIVVFNRQPSLHKMSMMGHRVKVLPFSTFRLNLSVTTPYNADFDGDEMNLHFPQSLETKAEVEQLMMVPRLIITPQNNSPIMGIVQDTLTAARKMTQRDVFLEKHDFMNLVMQFSDWDGCIPQPAIIKPKPLWTGKQLFSVIMQKLTRINCIRTHVTHPVDEDAGQYQWISPGDTRVLVANGCLLSGILCKKTLGTSSRSLAHIIFTEYGHETAGKFYSDVQTVVDNWLLIEGHSIGITDTLADDRTYEDIQSCINHAIDEVKSVIEEAHESHLADNTLEKVEEKINKILNDARNRIGSSVEESLSDFNQFKAMVLSGAKGSNINISQVIACVGQQNVEGKRIPFYFKHRTLPHFIKDDYSPASRGFIANSYLKGLQPSEFFFHAMGGREGLIDTAVKTSEIGYIQRRLIKAMESVMVKYDGTVRNQLDHLVQFVYGEDGLAGEKIELQSIDSLKLSNNCFEEQYKFDLSDEGFLNKYLQSDIVDNIRNINFDNTLSVLEQEWKQLNDDRQKLCEIVRIRLESNLHASTNFALPCCLDRLLANAKKLFKIDNNDKSNLSPLKIINNIENLFEKRLLIIKGNDYLSKEVQSNAITLLKILIRSTLSSKRIIKDHHLTDEAFDWICGEIESRFQQAQVQPGEMVGVLAAQSIGQPATQMTLNTFHYAGVSAKNVTLGVPRLKEIINCVKNPKTPAMTIFLTALAAKNAERCKDVLCQLEHCKLKHVILNTSIYYDPDPQETILIEDQEWVRAYYEILDQNITKLSPWVLRIELDHKRMTGRKLTMEQVADKIQQLYGSSINCIFNDDNSENLVLRIRLVEEEDDKNENEEINTTTNNDNIRMDDEQLLHAIETTMLSDLSLQGIKSISRVYMKEPSINDNKKPFIISGNGESEWTLETDGSSLNEVLVIKDVDSIRTYTNNIVEVFSVLGIEAVRKAIEREMTNVLSFDGTYIDNRHLSLLCDVMTARGALTPITRQGIQGQDLGPIMRSTFEQTVEVLMESSVHADKDPLRGVSENILLGQLPKMGTGYFDVLLDVDKCQSAMDIAPTKYGLTFHNFFDIDNKQSIGSTTPWYQQAITTPPQNKQSGSPFSDIGYAPFSPLTTLPNSPAYSPCYVSPKYRDKYFPTSPSHTPLSPSVSPVATRPHFTTLNSSEQRFLLTSSNIGTSSSPSYSPTSPLIFSLQSSPYRPRTYYNYSASSPTYVPSPAYINKTISNYPPTSPRYSPTSPDFTSNCSPYSHLSYSPTNPSFISQHPSSQRLSYSPTSPMIYTPQSPISSSTPVYNPTSPSYNSLRSRSDTPQSPQYSPTSPVYSPSITNLARSPFEKSQTLNTTIYSPTSPLSSSRSPNYSPTSPLSSSRSPNYSPTSPLSSSRSPNYSPTSPLSSSRSPNYSPLSPVYSIQSPAISSSDDEEENIDDDIMETE